MFCSPCFFCFTINSYITAYSQWTTTPGPITQPDSWLELWETWPTRGGSVREGVCVCVRRAVGPVGLRLPNLFVITSAASLMSTLSSELLRQPKTDVHPQATQACTSDKHRDTCTDNNSGWRNQADSSNWPTNSSGWPAHFCLRLTWTDFQNMEDHRHRDAFFRFLTL